MTPKRTKDDPDPIAWYIAPTYRQCKDPCWPLLKKMAAEFIVGRPNETDLSITLRQGGTIKLRSGENYDALRGPGLNLAVIDEAADIRKELWTEVIRPMLSDRLGRALFIGTPEGFNWFYDLYAEAGHMTDWARWQFTTAAGGRVSPAEIEAAKRDLDEKTFRQEYYATFETFSGRAYYAFDRNLDVEFVRYHPRRDLCLTCDFNVNPMSWLICQVEDVTDDYSRAYGDLRERLNVLDEIVLPGSNTSEAVTEALERLDTMTSATNGPIAIHVYGDPAGNSRSTAASGAAPSDWAIIRRAFEGRRDRYRALFHVKQSHPRVRDRINAVNALIKSADGDRRLRIDVSCRELCRDLEQVAWKKDAAGRSTGDLDKSDPKRTHMSDALGYLIETRWGLQADHGGPRSENIG
jgi:hypothetical protein